MPPETAVQTEPTEEYKVLLPIRHGKEFYAPGSSIALTEKEAAPLIATKAVQDNKPPAPEPPAKEELTQENIEQLGAALGEAVAEARGAADTANKAVADAQAAAAEAKQTLAAAQQVLADVKAAAGAPSAAPAADASKAAPADKTK
jgi:hypothetical protein